MSTYVDGPADQPWEVWADGCYVQRKGWDERHNDNVIEVYFSLNVGRLDQAAALVDRLNRLDAVEAALVRLADATAVALQPDRDELCPDAYGCKQCDAVRPAYAALAFAREVLG